MGQVLHGGVTTTEAVSRRRIAPTRIARGLSGRGVSADTLDHGADAV
jgi:hypothetical protein